MFKHLEPVRHLFSVDCGMMFGFGSTGKVQEVLMSAPAFTSCQAFLELPCKQLPSELVMCGELGLSVLLALHVHSLPDRQG